MNEYFEKYFIKATVSEPIRDVDQSSKPFISYLVTTETDNPSLIKLTTKVTETQIKVSVRRRYGDFRNLYHCLNNDFPFLLIPPLPSKSNLKYLTGDTFSQEFVHKRLNSLNRFIKFINGHKILSQSSVYHLFLSDSNDWLSFSKNIKISNISDVEKEQSFTSNMVNKVVNEELIAETVMNFLTPSKHKKETNKEILEITDKLKKMYENLLKLDKIFARLSKKNSDLSIDYHLFSQQIEKLAVVNETCNTDLVSINDNFKFFAECLNQYSENWSKSFTFINESFLTSLKDCSKYIVNLTNLIELQHNKKIDLQVLQEYLDKARNELNSFPATSSGQGTHRLPPSPIKNKTGGIVNNTTQLIRDTLSTSANGNISSSNTETKRAKLEAKVHQLEHEVELQTNLVQELINKITNEEYPNWDKFNKTELKSSMLELCDNQIDFYKGLVDNWNDTESKLMKRINELT
ncbi:hypothetical protein CANTEDRAFT_101839 [Yamadazyma tenuis ATCC 10573]|nr:uncharacterized protein CANTEDRAFT_101839 [Yamadazyma tenuis ATCC 10573]EGV65849.1 hypothetical protein CANTEDRAFT_101839 [Yamadazyma tenuis ATCC 10573]